MLRLFSRRAPAAPRPRTDRRTVDPMMTFTPREWADLPVHHPRTDASDRG
jgi:hypothetical protein